MKDIEEFVEKLVEIRYLEDHNTYGHYPFQLWVETNAGKFEMNALLLGGDVQSVYRRVGQYVSEKAKTIFLSCDFPETLDSGHDFVMIYSVINREINLFAIPYNPVTGQTFDKIHKGEFIDLIEKQFKIATGLLIKVMTEQN
jgi:hypothetical protein